MNRILFLKWNEGFQKISFTKLQQELLGLSLKQSKQNTDDFLDGKSVEVQVQDFSVANQFCKQAYFLGAICEVVTTL